MKTQRRKRANDALRRLHKHIEAEQAQCWLQGVCDDLNDERTVVAMVLTSRVQSNPPTATQEQIARACNVSRERVRTVERWLVRRLRSMLRYKHAGIGAIRGAGPCES